MKSLLFANVHEEWIPEFLFRHNFLENFTYDQELNKISSLIYFSLRIKQNDYTKTEKRTYLKENKCITEIVN